MAQIVSQGEKPSDGECVDAIIVDFEACTDDVSSSLTQEQRVRLEAEVKTALRAAGTKGAVEFTNTVVTETSDPVNLEVIATCLELAQKSANPPPEVRDAVVAAQGRAQEKAEGVTEGRSPSIALFNRGRTSESNPGQGNQLDAQADPRDHRIGAGSGDRDNEFKWKLLDNGSPFR